MRRVKILFPWRFIILLVLIMETFSVKAQTPAQNHDQVYGYDPLLYNGLVYRFFVLPQTKGTQYLFDAFDSQGTVTVRGITYTNVSLNYDICNQKLIMKYKNEIGASMLIQISYAWLEKASLGGSNFEVVIVADSSKRLYQVIGNGNVKIMYYLSKEFLLDNTKSTNSQYFSDSRKEMFVAKDGQLKGFRNNGAFIRIFSHGQQSSIKGYIRNHNINVKKAGDRAMNDLMNYCNTLSGL